MSRDTGPELPGLGSPRPVAPVVAVMEDRVEQQAITIETTVAR